MKEAVIRLLEDALAENETLFLVDFSISESNKITILIDGDQGIPISECVRVSRFIQKGLDEEERDYSIDVSSPGVDKPLQKIRQYKKNLNRKLKVTTNENAIFEGNLTEVDDEKIKLMWKQRESKPIGKGKHTVERTKEIPYTEIKEAIVQIIF
ncbi:MAG: ribosome assembly cofactor RimP [Flavobacteriales bacterium]